MHISSYNSAKAIPCLLIIPHLIAFAYHLTPYRTRCGCPDAVSHPASNLADSVASWAAIARLNNGCRPPHSIFNASPRRTSKIMNREFEFASSSNLGRMFSSWCSSFPDKMPLPRTQALQSTPPQSRSLRFKWVSALVVFFSRLQVNFLQPTSSQLSSTYIRSILFSLP